jgi:ABC-type molybdate transport system ATPase subunit
VLPHLTVRANLHYGGWMQRLRGLAFRRPFSVDELAERLELGPLMRRRAFRLSGGETRRVAFARALLSARTLLLLDEPFAGLDRPLRAAVRALTAEFHTRTGLPVLLATHHMSSVTALTPRALLLEQGHSVGCGALDDLAAHPATAESARRLGLPAGPARRRPRGDAVS